MNELRGRKIEILLSRYKEHATHMRHLDNFDVKIFGGFITVQLALASWFAVHPVDDLRIKFGLSLINLSLLAVAVFILYSSRRRRREVVQVIRNISEAFGLDRTGTYLPDKPINPPNNQKRFWGYELGCIFGFFGTTFVLFSSLEAIKNYGVG